MKSAHISNAWGTLLIISVVVLGSRTGAGAVPPNYDEMDTNDQRSPEQSPKTIGTFGTFNVSSKALMGSTGGDDCNTATVVPIAVGTPQSPTQITLMGDTSAATGPECFTGATVWWEAFELDRCGDVVLDFCGSSPAVSFNYTLMRQTCSPDGSSCGGALFSSGWNNSDCGDGNQTIFFRSLPAGTYYYPLSASSASSYTLNITAHECTGSCCNYVADTCSEDVLEGDCSGLNEFWTPGLRCCEIECRDPSGPEFDASQVSLLSNVPLDQFSSGSSAANDVWGYTSPSGREYAIIGLSEGTGFVDITDPTSPVVLADIPDAVSTWSDMAVYDQYAYNVNESSGGVQIINLSNIDSGSVVEDGSVQSGLITAHNIFINEQSGYMYPCGTNVSGGNGFLVYDLADPADPQPVTAWGENYGHDVYVRNYDSCPLTPPHPRSGQPCEIVFVFGGGSGLFIVDVTDKSALETLSGPTTYPNLSYCHQGWTSEDGRYLFTTDETDETSLNTPTAMYMFDIQDLENPVFLGSFSNGLCATDHNLMVRGTKVFSANYASGLRVYDVNDVSSVSEIAYFDTRPEDNAPGFPGAWGVFAGLPSKNVLISDRQRGLFVLKLESGACCGCTGPGCTDSEASCTEVTADLCAQAYPDGSYQFVAGVTCAEVQCPVGTCLGVNGSCLVEQPTVCVGGDNDGLSCDPTGVMATECPPGLPTANCPGLVGCDDPYCCSAVCAADPFCCSTTWDSDCAILAAQTCSVDCNNNGIFDGEDIATSSSADCDGNDVPDDCQADCDLDGVPDICELPPIGTGSDCNTNGVPDLCDIVDLVSQDCNGNAVPDECESVAPAAPLVEPDPVAKNRYLSLVASDPGTVTALRVTFEDLPGDYAIWNGFSMWVTDPRSVTESSGFAGNFPAPTRIVASLSCQQDCRDWGSIGMADVFGEGIIPDGQYRVEAIVCGCDTLDPSSYSPPLVISTSEYGDLTGQFDNVGCSWTQPNGVVSVPFDTVSDLEKFTNQPCAIRKARADLVGVPPNRACVDQVVSVSDYVETISAFQGIDYSFSPSAPDPCNALPCPNP